MRLPQNIVSVKSDEDGFDHRDHNILDGGLKIVAQISNEWFYRLTSRISNFQKTDLKLYV